MKSKIIIIGIVIVLAAVGIFYLVASKNSNQTATPQAIPSSEPTPPSVTAATSSPAAAAFDTNDNLDQAIQDLNQVE